MASFGEISLLIINKFFKKPQAADAASAEMQFEYSQTFLDAFGLLTSFHGKRILDLGCGTGGLAVRIAFSTEAKMVVGLDLRHPPLKEGRELASSQGVGSKVHFVAADGGQLPFRKEEFDIIVSFSAFEHTLDLASILRESYRVLRREGLLLVEFASYPSIYGHHLMELIKVPFAHLLFSERTLIKTWFKLKKGTRKKPAPDWILGQKNGEWYLAGLNKMTIDQFESQVRASKFDMAYLKYVTLSRVRWYLFPFRLLEKIPFFKDVTTVYIWCALVKRGC